MRPSEVVKYYSNDKVREQILKVAKHREVVPRFVNGQFGTRPQILDYDKDLFDYVRQGVSSFHASEERWLNPMQLGQNLSRRETDRIRTGWDLILDVDTKHIEYAKICAELLVEALRFHNVTSFSVKFSGGTGFHIGVPFEAFPEEVNRRRVKDMFPEAPQVIASYLRRMVKSYLGDRILELEGSVSKICKRTGKKFNEVVEKTDEGRQFNPYSVLEIDTVAIAPRHLFRMPYCLNEKTWLASVPIEAKDIPGFDLKKASPGKVVPNLGFLDKIPKKPEAKQLIMQALDWQMQEETVKEYKTEFQIPKNAVHPRLFPPCIKKILKGLKDGRKRSVFILINFLSSCGWGHKEIEAELMAWNKRNTELLKENYIRSQLKWHLRSRARYLPPNCSSRAYYKDIGVCNPDNVCSRIKNPVTYSLRGRRRRR
jgi:hypothetical protein